MDWSLPIRTRTIRVGQRGALSIFLRMLCVVDVFHEPDSPRQEPDNGENDEQASHGDTILTRSDATVNSDPIEMHSGPIEEATTLCFP